MSSQALAMPQGTATKAFTWLTHSSVYGATRP
jgi:hypothetical protein